MRIFNKYFWHDIKYKYITIPLYKRKLMKGIDFVTWDLVESLNEIPFKMLILFWEEWGKKRFYDYDYLQNLKTDPHGGDIWYDAILAMAEIYRYVKYIKPHNKEIYDYFITEKYKNWKILWEDCEDHSGCKELVTIPPEDDFEIEFFIGTDGFIVVKKVEATEQNKLNLHSLEQEIYKIEDYYLEKLIKYRRFMWD